MRADEAISIFKLEDYINQVRVDRLMAKARELKNEALYNDAITDKRYNQCYRIAEALEARAMRIKEGM